MLKSAIAAPLFSALLMPPLAAVVGGLDPDALRNDPGLVFSQERRSDYLLWLRYEVRSTISAARLSAYAEQRARGLCGNDHFRYLDMRELPADAADPREASVRGIELTVECLR